MRGLTLRCRSVPPSKFIARQAIGKNGKNRRELRLRAYKTADGDVLTADEEGRLEVWGDQKMEEALEKLIRAGETKAEPPSEVESAVLAIEQESLRNPQGDVLSLLDGQWTLFFSTATGVFKYVPVKEYAEVDSSKGSFNIGSEVGFVKFHIPGSFDWKGEENLMTFRFLKIETDVLGFKFEFELAKKDKFYTFFYVDENIACIRSKGKGITLMCRS
ncbi:hypothetical protein BSKO_00696 [Bryopsis sp. KO-2023]|nr:hypothetical protein BSKO_00696 [Bryopsis sp. KO-2023]